MKKAQEKQTNPQEKQPAPQATPTRVERVDERQETSHLSARGLFNEGCSALATARQYRCTSPLQPVAAMADSQTSKLSPPSTTVYRSFCGE